MYVNASDCSFSSANTAIHPSSLLRKCLWKRADHLGQPLVTSLPLFLLFLARMQPDASRTLTQDRRYRARISYKSPEGVTPDSTSCLALPFFPFIYVFFYLSTFCFVTCSSSFFLKSRTLNTFLAFVGICFPACRAMRMDGIIEDHWATKSIMTHSTSYTNTHTKIHTQIATPTQTGAFHPISLIRS